MENTRENIIKLLECMRKHAERMSKIFENSGDHENAHAYKAEAGAYFDAIRLLEDQKSYDRMYSIFEKVMDNDNQI